MKKGLIFSIIGCIVTSVGIFMEMHADKEDIKEDFRSSYEDEMRRIAREEINEKGGVD